MLKEPQNIIKISSQEEDGTYLQMVFDADELKHEEITERFQNFLRGIGYNITYDTSQVTRFEVIDHTLGGTGRVLSYYGADVNLLYQDDGRTLKVILTNKDEA